MPIFLRKLTLVSEIAIVSQRQFWELPANHRVSGHVAPTSGKMAVRLCSITGLQASLSALAIALGTDFWPSEPLSNATLGTALEKLVQRVPEASGCGSVEVVGGKGRNAVLLYRREMSEVG
ncbi:hypothetical protein J6590_055081 [Homalodisca vitripennis]|nr:hypothetical protein J6590_055081 [Homalodisca vitripennis]